MSFKPVRALGMSAYSFVVVLCLTLWHSILCVNSLVSSNPIKSPCRYLELFLCVAPSFPVLCPANSRFLSLPDSNVFLLTHRDHCALQGFFLLTARSRKCLQTETKGCHRLHLIYFPSLRDHCLLSNI